MFVEQKQETKIIKELVYGPTIKRTSRLSIYMIHIFTYVFENIIRFLKITVKYKLNRKNYKHQKNIK